MRKSLRVLELAVVGAVFAGLLGAAGQGVAIGETGTSEGARAMLERAVAALKADEAAALAAFTAGAQGFKDRDLYVFCGDAVDGTTTAHGGDPARVGQSMRDVTDETGKKFGEELIAAAAEGEFNVVEYVWPRPGQTEGVPKASYVTRVVDQICGVGYYK
jgi:signal transduction histidine kinase